MKKLILSFLGVFIFASVVCAAPPAGLDMDSMQNVIEFGAGTTGAVVTIEAFEHQNAILDKLYIKTDLADAKVWIVKKGVWSDGLSWEAQTTTQARTPDVYFELAGNGTTTGTTTEEVQELGTNNIYLPLWIGDKGYAMQISSEGTALVEIWALGRRGTVHPENPSINNSRF